MTFDIPGEKEETLWRRVVFRLIVALLCALLVVSLSKYSVEKYKEYRFASEYIAEHHSNKLLSTKENLNKKINSKQIFIS